ncbi:MAG: helix-turn-helix domain-containing protein [Prevotellaceae bacterium]|jgi:transcriptional regulator with XRE-family HTH domain|nr:helix-turn-helix domain-containing protein [Prevotellaceae bacterium]
MASLGTKLLNLRRQHKLSQTEIADILDISQNAYNKWEADKCKPSADNLLKLSQYYKIDIAELLDTHEKINLSGNDIKGGNNFFANNIPTINTVNIQPSPDIMERVLQTQEQISKLLESQFRLIEELLKKNK